MLEDSIPRADRIKTLSESSRSGASTPTHSEFSEFSLQANSLASNHARSRKQNIRELRDVFDDMPELYGIRRSGRSRKEPFRFQPRDSLTSIDRPRKRRDLDSSDDNDDANSSDSDADDQTAYWRSKHKNRSVRTRGNRVSYENAFKDDSSDGSDDGLSDLPKINRSLPSSQPTAFQKPKGPLIRELGSGFSTRSGRKLNAESISPLGHSEDTQLSEDLDYAGCRPQAVNGGDEEDVDVIEEVLLHAIRRKGATGNPTTLYNVRLEKDLNADFDPAKEPGEMQFLIKWRNWSHIHSTWETEASLLNPERGCPVLGMKKFYAYQTALSERQQRMRYAERDDLDALAYEEERSEQVLNDKMQVERIVAHSRDPESNTFDYLIKWRRLDYRYCTWESGRVVRELYAPAIAAYETRRCSTKLPSNRSEALYSRPRFCPIDQQPPYLGCGQGGQQYTLRDYQLDGINWIARSWCRGNSVILADEMGLGKTIQTIGFLSYLFHEQHIYGPFLIVVPLSTVSSWQTELELWAPDLNAIIYTGDHISRQLIREHEWSMNSAGGSRRQQNLKFNVCITTYEILLKDKSWLSQVSWAFLGVDEAHRLKNDSSQLYRTLKLFTTNTRLLITGTPLQNTLKELWALLHFIMPEKFPDWEEFEAAHSVASADDGDAFHNLHKVLRPFLLRRVKKDVESSLPEKLEQVLRVDMSKEQANIYRLILARNYDGLMKVTRGHRASFINIVMELKKCCNHAHLIAPPSENEMRLMTNEERLRSLVRGSGKMNLLDKLLQRLKPKGHRVLIFSQMVRMLDLIADYLSLRGWGFQRLDGSIRGAMRKQALDHFNAEGSTDFCFLLSTRAGGLGINLATADTVVIFDSDWNPQNDLQAQARAHRIGQTKQVSVYRLVTQDSVEEKIIESATRKMVLDHLVIQRMDSGLSKPGGGRRVDSAKGQLLTEILRYGAEGLFQQQQQTTEDEVEQEVDIDDILMRAETRDTEASAEANPASALLASFKVTSLDTYEDDLDSVKPTVANTKTWDQIIPAEIRDQVKAEETQKSFVELELGPRRRKQVKAFQAGLDPCSSSDESSNGAPANAHSSKPATTQLSEKEIRALVRAIKRFARPLERLDAIAADAELPDRSEQELREVVDAVLKGCQAAMSQAESTDTTGKGPVFQYGRVAVAAKPLLHNLHYLETLHKCLPSGDKDARMAFRLPFSPKPVAWSCQWDPSDDVRLLAGVYEHGYDNWEAIKLDVDLGLGSKLLPVSPSERPQANHLRTRVDYLLKMLAKHHDQSNKGSAEPGRKRKHAESSKSGGHKRPRRSHKQQHSANILRPKSAEFVSDSDCESNGVGPEDAAVAVSLKRTAKAEPKKGKKERNKQQKRREGDHSKDENRVSDSGLASMDNEEDFRRMRGPLFAKCKEKLLPIKKHFKHLERLEDADEEDTRMFSKVILRIGDHIHSVIADSQDRHFWKRYLWEFVQIFSKKTTTELRQIYRRAVKQRQDDDDVTGEQHHSHNRHNHHHHHHHHRHNSPTTVAPALASPDHTDSKRHWHRSPPGRTHGQESGPQRHSGYESGSRWGNSNHHFNRHKNLRDDSRFDNAFNRLPPSCGAYQPNHSEGYRGNSHYPVSSTTTTSTDTLKRPDSPMNRDPRLIPSSFRR